MGQKVNPHGLRVGVIKDWDSRWYARNEKVGDLLVEDKKIRDYLKKTLYSAGIPKIEIERDNAKVRIYLHCARPGVVIGKGGEQIEQYRLAVEKLIGKVEGDEKTGVKIIVNALQEPVRQIAKNAGVDGSVVLEKIKSSRKVGYGFDAYKEVYCDMIGAGIVDPAKVTRSALENAASVSSMVLTTEALVADKPEPPAPAAPAGMGGMDGMY